MSYLNTANSMPLYAAAGIILLFIAGLCVIFMVKSYRAGINAGMDRKALRKALTSSASFTVLPSVSILLGVIALSGSLGVPAAWLRLSVIGNLQYEATVAQMAAENMGTTLDSSVLSSDNLVTILAVMTFGIIWGGVLSIFTMKKYSAKLAIGRRTGGSGGFASIAMTAMMIGLCATFIGSYLSQAIRMTSLVPMLTAAVSGLLMWILSTISERRGLQALDSFSLALAMLGGMVASVLMNLGGLR